MSGLRRTRPEVVFSSAPPWTTHVVAGALAAIFRCRWVADFRDPWVRSQWTRYRSRTAARVAERLERQVIGRADAVVFTTATARDEYARAYGPSASSRLHVVFNGCDPSELPAAPPQDDRFVLLHAGSLYGGRSPLPLLQALAAIRRGSSDARPVTLRFLGSTSYPGLDVGRVCEDLGIGDLVEFLPRVSREESLREMQRAAALLILQAGTTMAIPGKLYEYLAARRPILALCEAGEMADFITSNGLGLAAPPSEPAALTRALEALPTFARTRWTPADPTLFDGRLRASELAAILETSSGTGVARSSAAVEVAR